MLILLLYLNAKPPGLKIERAKNVRMFFFLFLLVNQEKEGTVFFMESYELYYNSCFVDLKLLFSNKIV